jgi:type VI secretion system protein ImpG
MADPFYHAELNLLKERATAFAIANPALAPFLDGNRTDPDVERLLEAVAFLTAMLRRKLTGDFPELIQALTQLILPHYPRPIPATTIIGFTQHAGYGQSATIPAGTQIASAPVNGTRCRFTTTADVKLHPLELTDASFEQQSNRPGEIRLSLTLRGLPLSRWQPGIVRLFLAGDHAFATELYLLLSRHVNRIVLTSADGGSAVLPAGCLTPAGFSEAEQLLPYPPHAFPGYRLLQEYFSSPEKFLFFNLTGWEQWQERGEGMQFTLSFELDSFPCGAPRVQRDSFALHAVMASNLFPHDADPISVDHRAGRHSIRPAGTNPDHYKVFSVDRVTGYTRSTAREREYVPFEQFGSEGSTDPVYHAWLSQSVRHGSYQVHLSVAYPGEMPPPGTEILSIALTCTNGSLPENLRIGDITEPLSALPDFITARNITPINPGQPPPLGPGQLRQLISHLNLNLESLEHFENLRTLLELYVFPDQRSGSRGTANLRRIAGIEALEVTAGEQMVAGFSMRGREIRIKVRQDHFAGPGDMYLFGCVLDHFLGGYASVNTYTRLTFIETTREVTYQWPMRLSSSNQVGLVFNPRPDRSENRPSRQGPNLNKSRTGQNTSLIGDLLSHGHEFSFYQVMRIAQRGFGPGGKEHIPDVPWQDRVRIRPELSLAFPAADVARVISDGTGLLVENTFLGLYGVSSPLPTFYTEDQLDEAAADSSVSRDFLDIIHQRLYQIFFECLNKYRLLNRVVEEEKSPDLERLFCLIGLGEKESRDNIADAGLLLRYCGLFCQFPRSALGLQTLLRDALEISCLEVEQCVLRRVPIPEDQQTRLGISNICLGVSTVLGSEVADRMGKFRIHIGPLSKKEFDSLLPGTPRHDKLARLIGLYITDPLEYDLKLIMAAGEARPICLGDPDGPRLGLNSWCFSGETLGEVSAIYPLATSAAKASALDAEDFGLMAPEKTEPSTLVDYYQDELARLRALGVGYAKAHPNLAFMVTGVPADPSVERLFEGVAFINAHLRLEIDDDWSEIIHDLIDPIQPNYLRPIPASTIIVFAPKRNCIGVQLIPVGTELKSIPVDGTACRFTTRYPVEIHPLTLTNAYLSQPCGKPAAITLNLKLTGIALSDWNLKSLRLFLAGEYNDASNLYLGLMRYLKRVVIAPVQGGQSVMLDASHLKAVGFEDSEVLFPSLATGTDSLQMMHEYFIQSDKFLFLDLFGWESWFRRGEGSEFEIHFELDKLPFALHQVSKVDFALFATPAVNLFEHPAEPIDIDKEHFEYQVKPADNHLGHYAIYSVEQVTGLLNNTNKKLSFRSYQQGSTQPHTVPTYYVKLRNEAIHKGLDVFVSVETPKEKVSYKQITSLIVELACTNGTLPRKLQIGDICKSTDNSPSFADFSNCKPIKRSEYVLLGSNKLWRMYSNNALNISLLNKNILRAIMYQILQSYNFDHNKVRLNKNRIQGITDFTIKAKDSLFGESMRRGWEIRIKLNPELFDSPGDLYLFGAQLDNCLREFASESCFTRTLIEDVQGVELYAWHAKMGRKPLM